MTERKPADEDWDSFAERQIQSAQDAGEFDHLPGFGKPSPAIDEPYDEMWWVRRKMRSENLSALPPALQLRREVEDALEAVWKLPSEAAVRRAAETLNERVRRANLAIVWGPPSTTLPVEPDDIVRQWRERNS